MIQDKTELQNFIQNNNGKENIGWEVRGDRLFFIKERKEVKEIPAAKMINLCLSISIN